MGRMSTLGWSWSAWVRQMCGLQDNWTAQRVEVTLCVAVLGLGTFEKTQPLWA